MCSVGLLCFLTLLCCLHPRLAQQVQVPRSPERVGTGQGVASLSGHVAGDFTWGSVYVSGKITREEATCTDSSGQAAVNLTVLDLPAGYATASVTCKFLPWRTLQDLVEATEQWRDKVVPANRSQALLSLLKEVYWAEGTPARQQAVGVTGSKGQAGRVLEYNVTCALPSSLGDVSPVLLSEMDGSAFENVVVLTLAPTKLRRVAVFSSEPEVGPLTGGTEVTLQGEGFTAPMSCMFSNGSSVQTVNAKVQSTANATCIVPSWPYVSLNSTNGTLVDLKVAISGCLFDFSYGYYLNPLVKRVHPETGPRYGSFRLTVFLEDSLEILIGKENMLRPTLRIQGASEDGGDLLLPANLTEDRRALMAVTPRSSGPLTAGSHLLHVSLNGQFGGINNTDMVINMEGPVVAMAQPFISVNNNGGGAMEVAVELKGPNNLPVTAQLFLSQRLLTPDGSTLVKALQGAAAAAVLSADKVLWLPGESGRRNVTVHLSQPPVSQPPGGLLVTVGNVSNADLSLEQSSTVISDIPFANLTTEFAVIPNQVAYPGDAVIVPISIRNPLLQTPASVRYTIASASGKDLTEYIPEDALEGVIFWDQDLGSQYNLTIPVTWSSVPPEAEYRLTVTLEAAWRAVVNKPLKSTIAAHLFGVQPDQCPPGSYQLNSTEQATSGDAVQHPADSAAGQDVRLRAIVVRSANGTVYDLSSAVRPDVAEYGVAVPQSFGNGSLCVVPIQASTSVDVYGPDGTLLELWWPGKGGYESAHNRRLLLGDNVAAAPTAVLPAILHVQAPAAAPTGSLATNAAAQAQAGVAAMPSKPGAAVAAEGMCSSRFWPLSLEPGQNQFRVIVTAPPAMAPVASRITSSTMALVQLQGRSVNSTVSSVSHAPAAAPGLPPSGSAGAKHPFTPWSGSRSEVYTLSVVQLADPEHAEMMQLNATTSTKELLCVCGESCGGMVATLSTASGACMPNLPMWLNVSHKTEWVSLHPGLRWPGVPGLRVEVNGQVLSQGGDVSADQLADTTAETRTRAQADFLPIALVLGLSPGVPVEVPVVIIAEDGVTSLRYFLYIMRSLPPINATSPSSSVNGIGSLLGGSSGGSGTQSTGVAAAPSSGGLHFVPNGPGTGGGDTGKDSNPADLASILPDAPLQPGWPVPPSRQPWCGTCPAGWASTTINSGHCSLCSPGSFAASRRSPECTPCANGTYAYSWGSTHCNHCIIGTYAPRMGSKLCMMCPANMTNLEDGSHDCPVLVLPGTNLAARYAVIVSFGIYLNGTSLEEVAQKVGVNASSVMILEHLIRADTASAFNISVGDVNVTGISQVSRRVLYVNVTATLGVNVPPDASADDIKTALEVTNLSADDPIAMLAQNPDKFFGRTTKALDVTAEPDGVPPQRVEYRPGVGRSALAAAWPAIAGVGLAVLLGSCAALNLARRRSKHVARLWEALLERCRRCHPSRRMPWVPQVNTTGSEDASNVALSGAGLTARSKPAAFIQVQDAEPMYAFTAYSDGQPRRTK